MTANASHRPAGSRSPARPNRPPMMTAVQRPAVRSALRVAALWILAQGLLVLGMRLAARRLDRGTETSTDIRRVVGMGGVQLRPTNADLSRVRMDAVMGAACST